MCTKSVQMNNTSDDRTTAAPRPAINQVPLSIAELQKEIERWDSIADGCDDEKLQGEFDGMASSFRRVLAEMPAGNEHEIILKLRAAALYLRPDQLEKSKMDTGDMLCLSLIEDLKST